MSSDLRQRKPKPATTPQPSLDSSKTASHLRPPPPNLEPDIRVVLGLFFTFATIVITYYFYRVSYAEDGAFATFVNEKIIRGNTMVSELLLVYPKTRTKTIMAATEAVKTMAGRVTAA